METTPLVPKIRRLVFITLCVALSCLFTWPSSALEKGPKRVLVLHSYHPGLDWTNTIDSAIEEVFSEAGADIQIHVEYLDAKRYHDRKYLSQILEDLFQYKLAKRSFDLLLLSDNDALKFALKHRHDLFQGIPIVFCGINNFQPSMISGFKGITGIAESVVPRETIELALRLHPGTEEIVAINSTRDETGREVRELFLADMPRFQDRVRITLWDDLPLEEVEARLNRLPPGRLVLLNGIISDRAGQVFSYDEGIRRIRKASPVPLYGYWDFFLGHGIVGGKLISGTMQGRLAAQMALRILAGENPDDLSVIYSGANAYMFDYPELKRFGVPLEWLPENSIVINKPLPFYQVSKKQLWTALALMAVLTAVTGVLILNILSRRRAEEALREAKAAAEEASRAKSEFLANMSHEIRTPMTVFMAAIEHLLQIDGNPDRRHLLGMADQSVRRLRTLIDDILDFSRIEARKVEVEESPFDLRNCVREAVEMFVFPAREKGLRLEVEIEEQVPRTVLGDSNRLGQILINLVDNAVKFTHEGEIRVCVHSSKGFLYFSLADTGIGVPKEKRELLFESFSQMDTSFTRQYEGTGLGLAISKGLVELMGGEISVQSRKEKGSVFTFTLPLKVIEVHTPSPIEAKSKGAEDRPIAARILLAEDDPMIREMITMMLSQKGVQVAVAETGRDALEKWAEGSFDLIFMDLQMPEMNGLEATRRIREKEVKGEKRTWIIGLTAHARQEIGEECLKAGMDRVMTKPVQMRDLFAAVETSLPRK